MGLFDIFSAEGGENAAARSKAAANKGIQKATKETKEATGKAIGALETGQTTANTALTGAQTSATGALTGARDAGLGYLEGGANQGLGYLDQGINQAAGQYQNALDQYAPIAQQAGRGADLYGNFFGLGGQEGFDRAQSDFQSSPLYQSMVGEGSQGQQALDRQAQARGNPYNATDTLKYQGDLAGRYVNDYTSGLRPYLDQQGQVAGAQANIYGNLANLYNQGGANRANIATGLGTGQAGLAQGTGQNLSNVYTGTGQNLSNVATGTASNIGDTYTSMGNNLAGLANQQGQNNAQYYQNAYGAQQGANQNMWNGILGLATGAANVGSAYAGNPSAFGGGGSSYDPSWSNTMVTGA